MDRIEGLEKVTRVEVIGDDGREWVRWRLKSVDAHVQDNGRTLKIFIQEKEDVKRVNQG